MATCPICKKSAEEIEPGSIDRIVFRCGTPTERLPLRLCFANFGTLPVWLVPADADHVSRAHHVSRAR